MIEYKTGDLLADKADALVNAVNCVGVMGKGIAKQFKAEFPLNFQLYAMACKRGKVVPGKMFVTSTDRPSPQFIINFPTKRHWREKSELGYIRDGLDDLVRVIVERDIKTIAVPPLGCGLGGLDWNDVRPLIEERFAGLDNVRVDLFVPLYLL